MSSSEVFSDAPIERVSAAAYTVPTDGPESDGTLEWDRTTLVTVKVDAGGATGLGLTYAHPGAVAIIAETLAPEVCGRDAFAIESMWAAMNATVRNIGRPGLAACAISAVDIALWDLKARLLQLPLCALLGQVRKEVAVYGSGGFTSYDDSRLAEQLSGWVSEGCAWVKMKVGREPGRDISRVETARRAIGTAALFVDANGAYSRKQALELAASFGKSGVRWFEEPVSSDDLEGLRLLRDRCPAGMDIAAGEYGYTPTYFRRMLEAGAVDVLQADVTRCGGISGLLRAAHTCEAFGIPLSTHCAPAVHLHAACAIPGLIHMEWFHDHVRIDQELFDGIPRLKNGRVAPALSRAGHGLALR